MTWLITGGAGYIGAHVVRSMTGAGERVVVLDDLSTGVPERLEPGVAVVRGSVSDDQLLKQLIAEHAVRGVVHLAAHKQVGESVAHPLRYYRDNIGGLTTLLDAVAAAGITRFVFSSSAAVYGTPAVDLITEDTPCAPVSPYGETKLAGEWLVRAAGRAHGIRTVCLRYFNVAGAARPELADTGVFNIIPMVFDRLTHDDAPQIFGADYPTPDGTCVRDYVHVADVADAHLAAARWLASGSGQTTVDGDGPAGAPGNAPAAGTGSDQAGEVAGEVAAGEAGGAATGGDLTVNIGRGTGVSVRELVTLVGEVTGDTRPARVAARRPGDAPRAVASAARAAEVLGFTARRGAREMVESAWRGWLLRHPGVANGPW